MPHKTLDFTSREVQIAIWDSTGALRKGLEQNNLGTKEVWVNVTLLSPNGTTVRVYHKLCGHKPNGTPPVEQPPNTQKSVDLSAAMLMRLYKSASGRFQLPTRGIYHYNTHCMSFGRRVLLVTCVGFTDTMVGYQSTANMASGLWLLLHKLQQEQR